jgi:catechol 2,3-dioxygenase-like lactoylglutathione lyase family enzyme
MCLPVVCASSRNLVLRAPSYQPENLNHMALLRKIDCVMLRVDDLGAAREFYEQVLGLTPLWSDEHSVALGMPESEAEIVLHDDPGIPRDCNVHYLVDDVTDAVARLSAKG